MVSQGDYPVTDVGREAFEASQFEGMVIQITELKAALEQEKAARQAAEYQATHDELTGLLNRAGWRQLVQEEIDAHESGSKSGSFAVLFMDLDGFKAFNDIHGHLEGDALLQGVAETLGVIEGSLGHQQLRGGRDGGDEFTLLLELEPESQDEYTMTTEVLLDKRIGQCRQLITDYLQDHEAEIGSVGLGMAIGGSVWQAGMDISDLLSEADKVMFADKRGQGKSIFTKNPIDFARTAIKNTAYLALRGVGYPVDERLKRNG